MLPTNTTTATTRSPCFPPTSSDLSPRLTVQVCSLRQLILIDHVEIDVIAGRGGDGAVSFRREKFVPRGGPDGGDGGRGGNVVMVASRSISTLRDFQHGRVYSAEEGKPGGPNQRRGGSAPPLELRVPVGSVVNIASPVEGGAVDHVADLVTEGMSVVVARGGRGGWGNQRFATPTRQAPHFAQHGQLG